jgi:hypothetical protein
LKGETVDLFLVHRTTLWTGNRNKEKGSQGKKKKNPHIGKKKKNKEIGNDQLQIRIDRYKRGVVVDSTNEDTSLQAFLTP